MHALCFTSAMIPLLYDLSWPAGASKVVALWQGQDPLSLLPGTHPWSVEGC